jgi:gliding motility-associated-like protein
VPDFTLSFIPDSIISKGDSALVMVNGALIDSVFWSVGKQGKSIYLNQEGKYGVRVIDIHGCDAADSFSIRITSSIIPDFNGILTPNDDGINDIFVIKNISQFNPCAIKIYNRWGEEIYQSSNYDNSWNASYKGKKLPEGTYYFIMRDKNNILYTGTINILN